jgi:ligand-binding SRPBCC domain-containing protein
MTHKSYQLERTQIVPLPVEKVFAFFADAGNLERITPPFLHFHILTPLPIQMGPGTLIDYRLQLFHLPFRWRTRIETFEPGRRFIDVQLSGPYRRWHHLHEFFTVPEGALVRDVVDYALPFGPLGVIAHGLFVQRTLQQIFDHRQKRVTELLVEKEGA